MPKRPRLSRRQSSAEIALKRAGGVAHVSLPDLQQTGESFYRLGDEEAQREAREWFTQHDRDGDGVLNYEEYRDLLRSVGGRGAGASAEGRRLHPHYIEHFLKLSDADADGVITLGEFMRVYDGLLHFDLLLNAPRRRQPTGGDHPSEMSRLKTQSELVCPEFPTHAIELDQGPHGEFRVETRFDQLCPIGHGAYGVICSAVDTDTGDPVAIKKISPTDDPLQLRCCIRELSVLRHLGLHEHPNLLGLREVIHPPGGRLCDWKDLYLVTDLYEGDLHSVLRSDQPLTEEHAQFFVWQMLCGLHALHAAGVVHRDLKPSNLLINSDCELRIADFGISRSCPVAEGPEERSFVGTSYVVTRWYRCPELLCGNRRYSSQIDLWSAGCVLGEILRRAPLFSGEDHMKMLRQILGFVGPLAERDFEAIQDPRAVAFLKKVAAEGRPAVSAPEGDLSEASDASRDLLMGLLCFDPRRRLSAARALQHPWLERLHDEQDTEALPPPVDFKFEGCEINLDHFLLCGLDAVLETDPEYPVSIPQMLRFGIMQNVSVLPALNDMGVPTLFDIDDSDMLSVERWSISSASRRGSVNASLEDPFLEHPPGRATRQLRSSSDAQASQAPMMALHRHRKTSA